MWCGRKRNMQLNLKGQHASPTWKFTKENLKITKFRSVLVDYHYQITQRTGLHMKFQFNYWDIGHCFWNNISYQVLLKSAFWSNPNSQASVVLFFALDKDIKVKSVILKQRYFGRSTLKDALMSSILIFQPTSSLLFPLDTDGVRKIRSPNRRLWRPSSSCLRFPRLALIPRLLQNNSCSTKTSNISQFVSLCGNRWHLISELIFISSCKIVN